MPLTQLAPPYPIFTDRDGSPLDAGFLYFGVANLNPETNPIQVFYDTAFTQPVAQPIRTINGYPSRNGSPAAIYAPGQFSVTVRDKNKKLIIYSPLGYGFAPSYPVISSGWVQPEQFGAVGDGFTDDTAALQSFFNVGGDLFLPANSYLYDYLEFNTPFSLVGNGVLRYSGATPTSGTASIQINASVSAENLRISSSGSLEAAGDYIQASADNIRIGLLEIKADAQRNQVGGTNFYGNNLFIEQVVSENVARPIAFQPPTGTKNVRTNIHLGSLIGENYIRGLAISYADDWSVGAVNLKTRWLGVVTNNPGQNGVLVQACNNWTMGELYIADAAEHSFRIGGDASTTNFSIDEITSVKSAGCAMKFNVDPNYLAKDGQVGQLIAINTGEGSTSGNREVTRLTRCANINIGSISGYVWVTRCLVAQDISNVNVGSVYGENISSRAIEFRTDFDTSSGNVDGLYVGSVTAYMSAGARAAFGFDYSDGARAIGNIVIENSFATGFSKFLADANAINIYSGPIFIRARSLSSDPAGGVENVADTDFFQIDYTKGPNSYKGKAFNFDIKSVNSLSQSQFVAGSTTSPDELSALALISNGTAGVGEYGAGLSFGRVNSTRRGAAIVAKQTGTNEFNMGLAFLSGANSFATDQIAERMVIKHNSTVSIALQTFADNAAALSGGLVVGDVYKTASGELRIVV